MIADPLLNSRFIETDRLIEKMKKQLDNLEMGGGAAYIRDLRQSLKTLQDVQSEAYTRAEAMEKVLALATAGKLTQVRTRVRA